jgi:hypothetical protein
VEVEARHHPANGMQRRAVVAAGALELDVTHRFAAVQRELAGSAVQPSLHGELGADSQRPLEVGGHS